MAAPAASATLCAGAPLTAQPLTLALKASPFAWREQVDAPAAVAAPRPPNPNIRLLCVMILFGLSAAFAAPVFGFSLFSLPPCHHHKEASASWKSSFALVLGLIVGRAQWEIYCVEKKKRENAADSAIIHLLATEISTFFLDRRSVLLEATHEEGGQSARAHSRASSIDIMSMEDEELQRAIAASLEESGGHGGGASASPAGSAGGEGKGNDVDVDAGGEPEKPTGLSLEEKEAAAKAKLEEIKQKKVEEERKLDREREKERIRFGKEMLAQKKMLEDQERQRVMDFRKREKDEAKRAKQKVMEQIARDKAERRSRLGIKAEASAGEASSDAEQDGKRKQREEDSVFGVKPVQTQTKIRDVLVQIKKSYPSDRAQTCFKTLSAYCKNLLRVPAEQKFRTINVENNAFRQRVGSLEGGEGTKVLELVGFAANEEAKTLAMADDRFSKLVVEAALTELNNALTNPFFGSL